ncbi:MAG: bifunctional phosphoribosylaminoimidazolecarboxamide formyltransferase/IMP cyclohydrolase PurH, partial [Actinomycetota bacterium]|nr:bifunctional phosphoribosylaminoimidazolecarboxamide formyltransferase/IMP cyclohydrolase PurH [Actinomycetota bacterium]
MRALISTYDKTGVVELARALVDVGFDLVSSGGTASAIAAAGLAVTDTAALTGFPAILGHRVVTLHPRVHGGILADPTDPAHRADMAEHGIEAFDLVVVNAYPFGSDPADFEHGGGAGAMDVLDIGGPAMIRAAAKNHAHVGVVTDPADYAEVLAELQASGALSDGLRRRLARKAFAFTSAYDAAIVRWFDAGDDSEADGDGPFPDTLHLSYRKEPTVLRYGENPHQSAALYRHTTAAGPWWASMTQHSGLALSYLNLFDADAAWLLAHDLGAATGRAACAIIKHANPCGAAVAG